MQNFHEGFSTGESSHYMVNPNAMKKIKQVVPDIKLIVLLRNPIDRAYSHYRLEVKQKRENLTFEEALEIEDKRISNEIEKMVKQNIFSEKFYYWSYKFQGCYYNFLEKWFELFPKNQFLIIESNELYNNPSFVFEKIFKFTKK